MLPANVKMMAAGCKAILALGNGQYKDHLANLGRMSKSSFKSAFFGYKIYLKVPNR